MPKTHSENLTGKQECSHLQHDLVIHPRANIEGSRSGRAAQCPPTPSSCSLWWAHRALWPYLSKVKVWRAKSQHPTSSCPPGRRTPEEAWAYSFPAAPLIRQLCRVRVPRSEDKMRTEDDPATKGQELHAAIGTCCKTHKTE